MAGEKDIEQLPKRWARMTIGKIADVNPKNDNKKVIEAEREVQFVPMKLVEEVVNKVHLTETRLFREVSTGSYTPFKNGDILFAKVTPCMENGKIAIANSLKSGVGYGSSEFHVIRCNGEVLNKYLFYYLVRDVFRSDAQNAMTGAVGLRRVPRQFIENYPIPFPSRSMQQSIVSKIEELYSELDKGVEQLKTAQQQIKTYRQAVLKWAFEGRFTSENVKTGNLPQGWKWCKSGELFDFVTSGSRGWAKYYSDKGAIFLRITNMDFDSLNLDLDESKIQYVVPPSGSEGLRTKVNEGDFLFSITGYLGMFAIAPRLDNAFVNQHISLCRPKPGFNSRFVGYWIISKCGGHYYLNKDTRGVTKAGLGLEDIKMFPVPMASVEEQKRVVEAIESRLSEADTMQKTINKSLRQADSLRQSILKMAFEGRLVANDTLASISNAAKVIPVERKILAGKIIHLLHNERHFGLTKFQKLLYLVENFAEVPYETNFIQERAGPYDKEFTIAFRKEMQEKDWLHEEQKGSITKFAPGTGIGSLIREYGTYFKAKSKSISFVLQQLKDKNTHDVELIATLYAVWNNRLISKKSVKIDALVDDFFGWSPKKKDEFQRQEIVAIFEWMKKIKLMPKGFGKIIGPEA